jgi:hypothetical protein
MTLFRVHFSDGTSAEITAETPDQARKSVRKGEGQIITKIKVVKEKKTGRG